MAQQGEGAHDDVERGVGKRQVVGVAFTQIRAPAELGGPPLGDVEHGRAPFDPGQPDVLGVEGQVETGTDGDLQHVADRLGADPGAGVTEQDSLEELHLPVIGRRMLVPVPA